MGNAAKQIAGIFDQAILQPGAAQRDLYLAKACGNDAGLRSRVQALLDAHDKRGGFVAPTEEAPAENASAIPTMSAGGHPVASAATAAARPRAASKAGQPAKRGGTNVIGRYKLLQKIGEGGFGVVYMAEQETPVKRRVALKVIKAGMDTRQVIARFEAERQALAMMDHPNIARVLDAGATDSGRPYFVMELVKGFPITDYCDQARLNTTQRLVLFMDVCGAVQHAHQKGVIHRDLKPSNVMVTLRDDKPIVKVIDFGIAKATEQKLTEKTLFTAYGQMIGTPAYMSPEQAAMNELDIDTRSDVYSLGVLLYELLTGITPLDSKALRGFGYDKIVQMIREVEPPRPSTRLSTMGDELITVAARRQIDPMKLRRLLRGELDWIIMKALEKDRTRRYATANGLAMDVGRYLKNEAVSASPPSQWYALRRLMRRHRGPVAAVALVVWALMVCLAGATYGLFRAQAAQRSEAVQKQIALRERGVAVDEQRSADKAREQAQISRRKAEQALASIYPSNGFRASDESEDAVASLWFAKAADLSGLASEAGRINAQRAIEWTRRICTPVAAVIAPGEWVQDLQLHPAGRYLLVRTLDRSHANGESTFSVWDLYRELPLALPADLGAVTAAAWSDDGKWLAAGNGSGVVWRLNWPTMEHVQTTRVVGRVGALSFDRPGRKLAIVANNIVTIFNCAEGLQSGPPLIHPAAVTSAKFSPDSNRLLTTCFDQSARVFDIAGGRAGPLFAPMPHRMGPFNGPVHPTDATFFDGGKVVLTVGDTGVVWHDADDGKVIRTTLVPDGLLGLSATDDEVAIAGGAKTQVLDASGNVLRAAEQQGTTCIASCPDHRQVAMASGQTVGFCWAIGNPALNWLPEHSAPISCVAFSPDARFCITAQRGGLIRAWAVPKLPLVASIKLDGAYSEVRFSSDGLHMMPCGSNYVDGQIATTRVYELTGGPASPNLDPHGQIRSAAFSPSGQEVAMIVGFGGSQLQLWNWKSGQRSAVVPLDSTAQSFSYSADGKWIAVVCMNGSVLVDAVHGSIRFHWDFSDPCIAAELLDSGTNFTPDCKSLILCGTHGVIARDVETGEQKYQPLASSVGVNGQCVSPDGQFFATSSNDGEVRVYETSTGKQLIKSLHGIAGSGVSFNSDGRLLMTTRGTLNVWDWRAGKVLFAPITVVGLASWTTSGTIVAATHGSILLIDSSSGALLRRVYVPLASFTVAPSGELIGVATGKGLSQVLSVKADTSPVQPGEVGPFGELTAAKTILDDGTIVGLSATEWMDRWKLYRSSRPDASPMSAMSDEAVAFHRQKAADFHNSGAARAFHIERLLALGAARPDEQIARADVLAGRGQWEQAADALKAVTAGPVNDLELIQDLADLMPIMDDPAGAEAQFSKLLEHLSSTDRLLVRGNWWTAGPFTGTPDVELSQPPDLDARKSASAVSKGPELHWRMAESRAPNMDLSAVYANAKHVSVYAQTRIYSGKDRDILLTAQAADEVWLNAKRIYEKSTMGSTELIASLHRGWNSVVGRVEITGPNTLTFGLTEDPVALSQYFRDYPRVGLVMGLPAAEEAVDSDPGENWTWYYDVTMLAYSNRADLYAARRTEMLKRFAGTKDRDIAERTAKTAMLMPIGLEELKQATALIDFAVSPGGSDAVEKWYMLCKGLNEYRLGSSDPSHWEQAITWLNRRGGGNTSLSYLASADYYLALAHLRLGHVAEARAAFDAAEQRVENHMSKDGDDKDGVENWLICQVARREAEAAFGLAPVSGPSTKPVDVANDNILDKRLQAMLKGRGIPSTNPAVGASALFWFKYKNEPHIWTQSDATHWEEVYPDGHSTKFVIEKTFTEGESIGTVVRKDDGFEVLIPPVEEGRPLRFRDKPGNRWAYLGPIHLITKSYRTAAFAAEQADRELADGHTSEAIVHLVAASAGEPDNSLLSMKVAALQAWFGQDTELAATVRRAREHARGTRDEERAAKIGSLRPTADKALLEASVKVARRAVELGKGDGLFPYFQMTLGMAEYRSGHYQAAEEALNAAAKSVTDDFSKRFVPGTSAFYRAMSLYRLGREAEARALAAEATAKMTPLPADGKNPMAGGATLDDLILWMAYKEAQAMLKAPAAPAERPKQN